MGASFTQGAAGYRAVAAAAGRGRPARWLLPVPRRSGARLGAEAHSILAGRQFQHQPSLLQRLVNWVTSHLGLSHLSAPAINADDLAYVALAALALLVAAGVALALRRGGWARLRHPAPAGVLVTGKGPLLPPEAWDEQAARLEAEGRYREAMRCRYRALVAELARHQLLEEVPGRTSGDYERLVSLGAPQLAADFSVATGHFERAWYGGEEPPENARRDFEGAARAVVARAGGPRQRAAVDVVTVARR